MKKILLWLGAIFVILFIVLSLLDRSDYPVEKKLWMIKKQVEGIARDPKVVPGKKFEDVIGQYQEIIQQYPQSKLLARIYLQIGRVYILKEDYARARTVLTEMRQRYPQEQILGSEALFDIGNSYELEEDFNNAIKTYHAVYENYPLTEVGLNTPLYIANYYFRSGKGKEAQQAFEEAARYYTKIAQEYAQTPVAYSALQSLVTCYVALENWSGAVDVLEKVLVEFPSPEYLNAENLTIIIKSINTIALTQLNDYDRSQRIYELFLARYPKHPLGDHLREAIQSINELKAKNNTLAIIQ